MFADPADQVAWLQSEIRDADRHIDQALDRGSRREFKVWIKRRQALARRLQNLLLIVATH